MESEDSCDGLPTERTDGKPGDDLSQVSQRTPKEVTKRSGDESDAVLGNGINGQRPNGFAPHRSWRKAGESLRIELWTSPTWEKAQIQKNLRKERGRYTYRLKVFHACDHRRTTKWGIVKDQPLFERV